MRIATVLAVLGTLAMGIVLAYGFGLGSFAAEGGQLLSMPWGGVSLVDLYVGFFLFSGWIFFREGVRLRALVWSAAVMILGSLAICLYVLATLRASQGDWHRFFLGRRGGSSS